MEKTDLKQQFKELYRPPAQPVVVDVPSLNFLMIDGSGSPEQSERFQSAVGALYGIAYTLKFMLKKAPVDDVGDFTVMPLEGLYGEAASGEQAAGFMHDDPASWSWTLMMALPDHITPELVAAATEELRRRKDPPCLDDVRFERLSEGRCVQVMYVGPYDAEVPTIERLHAFALEQGFGLCGRHHEVYLGDPRRTAPERLKTVIRQPVTAA
jgi:hypothetical protein